jgi:uncharacterized protein
MDVELLQLIRNMNPWLDDGAIFPLSSAQYIARLQTEKLLLADWDKIWLVLTGPRQAGKTTLGKFIAQQLIQQNRFENLLYLNCDFLEIRQYLRSPHFIQELMEEFNLKRPILFIDEAQRLENPGLLLKGIVDLQLPIKLIASGSSQLELKSTIQEYLTGRHLEALVLPFSYREIGETKETYLIYGLYPAIVLAQQKEIMLQQLYKDYISKDIIEILKVGKPDVMQKLIRLIAHNSGQLVNYNQLATDCRVSIPTIQHYCSILENTYTLSSIKPFVGNKRKEIVSNPIFYFIDNGFRNQALRQFSSLNARTRSDVGLLVQGAVFQELLKHRVQSFGNFDIHYWRTHGGAEVDFVVYFNEERFIPIEIKYRNLQRATVTRSLRSFIEAYTPKKAIMVTKNFRTQIDVDGCHVYFIPFQNLTEILPIIDGI